MVREIAATSSLMFCFKSTVVLSFYSYTLLLRYPQRKKSQALRSGDLADHSVFPLREITRSENISLRTRIAVLTVFFAWTITILQGWKFKSSCNIRLAVRSDILNAMAFLLADRRGFLTKAWRNCSMFSGVLSEGSLPGRFLFAAYPVSLKFLTHNSTVLRLWTLSFRRISKCRRNIHWVTTTESLFF